LAGKKFDVLTPKLRREMMKKRFSENEIKRIIDYYKRGLTVWQVTEEIYGFKFDHSDRRTWIFYQKVNNVRHRYGLAPVTLNLTPDGRTALKKFIERHGEQKLIALIRANTK